MPTEQVLERCPIRRAIPGSIEQRGFEYTRHDTVNIPTFLQHIAHIIASWLEFNRLYAHPFEWT
jgi:hypothetical protein